jgi:hypothetical protein
MQVLRLAANAMAFARRSRSRRPEAKERALERVFDLMPMQARLTTLQVGGRSVKEIAPMLDLTGRHAPTSQMRLQEDRRQAAGRSDPPRRSSAERGAHDRACRGLL